jgi:arylsulfatase A
VADETLLIFTSDNGPEVTGEVRPGVYDRALRYNHFSMGNWRGAKRDLWEGGHRVPFIARWPGKIKPDSTSAETICHVDFLATVAATLDAKLPENAGEDSYNLLPVLLGEQAHSPVREATVHHSGSGRFAIRRGEWVLIAAPGGDDNAGPGKTSEPGWFKKKRGYATTQKPGVALYDLRQDAAERRDLAAERPEIVQQLRSLLQKYIDDGRSTPGQPQKNDVPIDVGRLP